MPWCVLLDGREHRHRDTAMPFTKEQMLGVRLTLHGHAHGTALLRSCIICLCKILSKFLNSLPEICTQGFIYWPVILQNPFKETSLVTNYRNDPQKHSLCFTRQNAGSGWPQPSSWPHGSISFLFVYRGLKVPLAVREGPRRSQEDNRASQDRY